MYGRCERMWTSRRLRATRARRNDRCESRLCVCASNYFVYPLVGVCITRLCVFRGIERFWFGRGVVEDAVRGRWVRG